MRRHRVRNVENKLTNVDIGRVDLVATRLNGTVQRIFADVARNLHCFFVLDVDGRQCDGVDDAVVIVVVAVVVVDVVVVDVCCVRSSVQFFVLGRLE